MLALKKPILSQKRKTSFKIVKTTCKTDGAEGEAVYGIEAFRKDSYAIVEDISPNKHYVQQLLFKLNKGNVSPDQLIYIVEDYIVELY